MCRDCRHAGKSAGRQLLVYRDQECVQGLQAAGKSAGRYLLVYRDQECVQGLQAGRQVGRQATIGI